MIPFNEPVFLGKELDYIKEAINNKKLSGDNAFSKKCQLWFSKHTGAQSSLLMPSCTHALELAAILLDIKSGDEVILPSFTFVSTANAFALRGAKIVFVDVRPDTMNIDEKLIEKAITPRTKAIVPVHYAGVACEMDVIMALAKDYNLYVVEDAAQGMMSRYKGKQLGSIGHLGAYSFHETKNYTSGGEGGLLLINDERFSHRAEVIREKGTNRSQFFRGMIDKYTWVDIGSSYLPSELQAAYLLAQLEEANKINSRRLEIWSRYREGLSPLASSEFLKLPIIPPECDHNAHMFYIKTPSLQIRTDLMEYLKKHSISTAFHYIPLHSSPAGEHFGYFSGSDNYTTLHSEQLLRLPLFYSLSNEDVDFIISKITEFFK